MTRLCSGIEVEIRGYEKSTSYRDALLKETTFTLSNVKSYSSSFEILSSKKLKSKVFQIQ